MPSTKDLGTHAERLEEWVKLLQQENLRLRGILELNERERDALREENERLRNAFALAEPSLEARTDFYRQAKARPE